MTLVERVAEWPKQWFREGLEQGREQGLAHERMLLRRQAASRFGEDTAARLSETLAQVTDPERLTDVGEWLVRCDTGAELLARVAQDGRRTAWGRRLTGCSPRRKTARLPLGCTGLRSGGGAEARAAAPCHNAGRQPWLAVYPCDGADSL